MEEMNDDVPLPAKGLCVGVVYNLKSGEAHEAEDAEAEYDSIDTVEAIGRALEQSGARVALFQAGSGLYDSLRDNPPDIVFNIAEGFTGRGRESQIPALLDVLGIPYTGSDETALCVALDKAMCKKLASACGVRTPGAVLIEQPGNIAAAQKLRFPLIVKPNAEGSSKGIPDVCVVHDAGELAALAERDLRLYGGAVLAEEYIDGREFTVGLLGNGETCRVFSPMEIVFRAPTHGGAHVYSYSVKKNYQAYIDYRCPAAITPAQAQKMADMARAVYNELGCRDFARVDFRMDAQGRPYFIEINPLPGLAPGYSDYPMLAAFCGMPYEKLVAEVLMAAVRRCNLTPSR